MLPGAATASLTAVGIVLAGAGHASGIPQYLQAGLALMSVFVSWILLHTACTLRYAVSATPARAAESASTRPPPRTMATSPAVLHDRHDVPGLRHRRRIETDTADRAAARVTVVPMGAVIIATTIDAVALARTLTRFQAGRPGPAGLDVTAVARWGSDWRSPSPLWSAIRAAA